MSIPLYLLAATESRAPGIGVYGGAGLLKTNTACTLPPPVRYCDIGEGGTASLLPWIARRRNSTTQQWTVYTQEDRERFLALLDPETLAGRYRTGLGSLRPAPYIDVVSYDNMRYESWEEFKSDLANLDYNYYNSIAIDSLQELSISAQTFTKGAGNVMIQMNEVRGGFAWANAQERAGTILRVVRNVRAQGIFVYLVGAEDIAKDYVTNPMSKKPGEPTPEAYSVRGTVDLPGKLAGALSHVPDILAHVRLLNGTAVWITEPEMLPGGGASWDAKDRYGRLARYEVPNIRTICRKLYGTEGYEAIYNHCLKGLTRDTPSLVAQPAL